MADPTKPDLANAIAKMVNLKDEHRPLLQQIAADPGMAPETREALVMHVYEEEDEALATIVAAKSGSGGAPSAPSAAPSPNPAAAASARRPGLTVGSLRGPGSSAVWTNSGTVGFFRKP